jgi:hypothetical protein
MPTAEQVARWADDFETSYPEALSDRLRWFHDNLGIAQDRLLRLVGLSSAEVKELREGCVDWKWVAQKYDNGTESLFQRGYEPRPSGSGGVLPGPNPAP